MYHRATAISYGMNSKEKSSDSAISLRLNEPELEALALLLPEHKKRAIKIKDFSDLYGEGVAKDLQEVGRLKAAFEAENKDKGPEFLDCMKRAKFFEALLAERVELDNWLGENAQTIVASEYDDIKNGVDLAIEFSTEGGFKHLALSVDVTTSRQVVAQKIERIKEEIVGGKLTTIKYFYSEDSNIRGQLMRVPRVLIGADIATAKELATLWLKTKRPNDDREARQSLQALALHRIQFQILEEIKTQLEYFVEFARENKKEGLISEYRKALAVISEILEQKLAEIKLSEEERQRVQNDPVYKAIAIETGKIVQ